MRRRVCLVLAVGLVAVTMFVSPPSAEAADTNVIVDSVGTVGLFTSIELTSDGKPVISYYDSSNGDLKIAFCDTALCESPTNRTLDSAGSVGRYTSLALDALDRPVISYFDATNGDLEILRCLDVACAGTTITTIASADTIGWFSSLVLNAAGNPVIAYHDVTNGDLEILTCGDATCSAGNTFTNPDTAGTVGQYNSLALNGAGMPVVSYYDATNGDLEILTCGNTTCSAGNTITTISTFDVGRWSSLVLDSSGNPVISYQDASNGDLKVTICTNPTCTTRTTATPDTVDDVGSSTSLGLTSGDVPIVAYYDTTNTDLLVLTCGDTTCSDDNTIHVADTEGIVGLHTSLTLNGDGDFFVSYHDTTNGDLKLLGCDDELCEFDPCADPGPLANDDFECSTVIPSTPIPVTVAGSTVDATWQVGEPPASCGGGPADSAWWSWTADETETVTIDTFDSGFDTILSVWKGTALDDISEQACNDDAGTGFQSLVEIDVVAGSTYYIRVHGFSPGVQGAVMVTISKELGTGYMPMTPTRILDSRDGTGGFTTPWDSATTRTVKIAGEGGVPATGVSAVAMHVTSVGPTADSFLTVWPEGARPTAASKNFGPTDGGGAGHTATANDLLIVQLSDAGNVQFYNNLGKVDFTADVVGYFMESSGDLYNPLTPARIVDSRNGPGGFATPWDSLTTRTITVLGAGGVPAAGVSAVALQVTSVEPEVDSFVVVWPDGARPLAASKNFGVTAGGPGGHTGLTNDLLIVPVGAGGTVEIYNNLGKVHLVIDVVGYFAPDDGAEFFPLPPDRFLDSRDGTGGFATPWGVEETRSVQVTDLGDIPVTADAVLAHVTSVGPTADSFLTAWPGGIRPKAALKNYGTTAGGPMGHAGVTNDLLILTVGASGLVEFYNNAGSVDFVIDVVGYFDDETSQSGLLPPK